MSIQKMLIALMLALSLTIIGIHSLDLLVRPATAHTGPPWPGLVTHASLASDNPALSTGLGTAPNRAPPASQADVSTQAVFTVTLTPSKDNTLYEDATGSLSNGAGPGFFVGRVGPMGSNRIRRGVIAFDLASNIPAGATILSATLKLNMSQGVGGNQAITLHRLSADWGEGTSNAGLPGGGGAPATSGDATWIHRFFNTVNWTTAGGDFVATASATATVNSTGSYTWGSTPQMVANAQGWLDAPATNFGWLLKSNEVTPGTAKRFDSRENGTPANRPTLIVVYSLPPTPNLSVSKQVSHPTPTDGQVITYTLVVANSGDANATGAVVSDTLPAGLTFIGPVVINPPGAGIPGAPPTLANGLTITAGQQVTLTFPITVSTGLSGTTLIANTAAVTSVEVTTPVTGMVVITVINSPFRVYLPLIIRGN